MKVLVKSDRVPIVLLIIGAVMVMVSSLEFTERNQDVLFFMGIPTMLLGFMLWAVPGIVRMVKKWSRDMGFGTRTQQENRPRPRNMQTRR